MSLLLVIYRKMTAIEITLAGKNHVLYISLKVCDDDDGYDKMVLMVLLTLPILLSLTVVSLHNIVQYKLNAAAYNIDVVSFSIKTHFL